MEDRSQRQPRSCFVGCRWSTPGSLPAGYEASKFLLCVEAGALLLARLLANQLLQLLRFLGGVLGCWCGTRGVGAQADQAKRQHGHDLADYPRWRSSPNGDRSLAEHRIPVNIALGF